VLGGTIISGKLKIDLVQRNRRRTGKFLAGANSPPHQGGSVLTASHCLFMCWEPVLNTYAEATRNQQFDRGYIAPLARPARTLMISW
jgi:hypothetical protein